MTTREAARPLRRYLRARVRAASLAPTYTITRDVTSARLLRPGLAHPHPPGSGRPLSSAEVHEDRIGDGKQLRGAS